MAVKRLSNERLQYDDSNGALANGYRLFFYVAGSSTKLNTYNSSTGLSANSNPVTLNALGEPTTEIWLTVGQSYKMVLAPAGIDDPPNAPVWTEDNITGVNDATVTVDEWIASALTPTYVNATSFTLAGDQTSAFHAGRRVKTTNTSGSVYSTISTSVFGALTTVTLFNDSTTLDSGLSAVAYGILRTTPHSIPRIRAKGDLLTLTQAGSLGRVFVGTDGYKFAASSGDLQGLVWQGPGMELWNGSLVASQNGTVLTVAVKTHAGGDPSDSDPVFIYFRSSTATTGDVTIVKVVSATSIATTVAGTYGVANNVPFRLWIVGFNDAGTFRLAFINCMTTVAGAGSGRDVTAIFPLTQFAIVSSTLIGAGSTSAGVFYSAGAAVTSKAYAILGHLTYESGLATAGTFNVNHSRLDLYRAGSPLPGFSVNVVRNDTGAVATGTTVVPNDDTIPQSGEGDQYMTQAITPTSAANALLVVGNAAYLSTTGGANTVIATLYQDAVANGLKSVKFDTPNTSGLPLLLEHFMLASTTSATTFKERIGPVNAGTLTFNGSAGARQMGGALNSYMRVEEIMG